MHKAATEYKRFSTGTLNRDDFINDIF